LTRVASACGVCRQAITVTTLGVTLTLGACHAPAPSSPRPTIGRTEAQAPMTPLDYVPAAGLKWLISCRPARIFADPVLGPAVGRLLPSERLDALALATAVDVRRLESAAAAGYALGNLYVVLLPTSDGGRARTRFEERLSVGAVVKQPLPNLYRVAGTRAGSPHALVAVDDRLLAFAVDDLTLARIAEAYAERRLKSPTALHGASLSKLPQVAEDTLAAFYVPGPFSDEWRQAVGGLLGSALGLRVALRRGEGDTLRADVLAVGEWTEADREDRARGTWAALASSSTGRLLGLDQAKNMKVVADLHLLTWSAELSLELLVAGLRAATIANVPEIFDVRGEAPAGSPAEQSPTNGPTREPAPKP
jgi:hypothetical protein